MALDGVHFVGSVNLPDAETTFRKLAASTGRYAARLPDGETGERASWIGWLIDRFQQSPALEERAPQLLAGHERPSFGIAPDVADPKDLQLNFGYADVAVRSYKLFEELRKDGVIGQDMRFQVTFATPGVLLTVFIDPAERARAEEGIIAAFAEEIRQITAKIPHSDLAIQWDAPAEVGMVEKVFDNYYATDDVRKEAVARLARLGDLVPSDVQLGYHLCYGDTGDVDDPEGSHWKNPDDLGVVTAIMNDLTAVSRRPITYFHVPVPIRRDDADYFAPLAGLNIPEESTVYLGLLHREDGVDGAQRRISAARQFRSKFGVATECGMGRERQESIDGLLEIHAAAGEL